MAKRKTAPLVLSAAAPAAAWCCTCVKVRVPPPESQVVAGEVIHGSKLFCAEAVRAGGRSRRTSR
jgi:hypothetical protein